MKLKPFQWVLFIILVVVIIAYVYQSFTTPRSKRRVIKQYVLCKRCHAVIAVNEVYAMTTRKDYAETTYAYCDSCKAIVEDSLAKVNYAKAVELAKKARESYAKGDYQQAYEYIVKALDKAGKNQKREWLDLEDRIYKKIEAKIRAQYAKRLRNWCLDRGLDIKVWVSGPNNTYLHLKYVLFDDVWVHKFRKGEIFDIDEIHSLGFKRVYFTNGYDYNTYVYWQ